MDRVYYKNIEQMCKQNSTQNNRQCDRQNSTQNNRQCDKQKDKLDNIQNNIRYCDNHHINNRRGRIINVGVESFVEMVKSGKNLVIDVRSRDEYGKKHVINAVNVPMDILIDYFSEEEKNVRYEKNIEGTKNMRCGRINGYGINGYGINGYGINGREIFFDNSELKKIEEHNRNIILYCETGGRSLECAKILASKGYEIYNFFFGLNGLQKYLKSRGNDV